MVGGDSSCGGTYPVVSSMTIVGDEGSKSFVFLLEMEMTMLQKNSWALKVEDTVALLSCKHN